MVADFQRPYLYAIEAPASGSANGSLLFINAMTGTLDKTLTISTNPADMAINAAESKLYVLDRASKTVYGVDLIAQTLTSTFSFPTVLSTVSGLNQGRFLVGGQGNFYICNTWTGLPVSTNWIAFDGAGAVDSSGSSFFLGTVGGFPPQIEKYQIQGDYLAAGAPALVQQYQYVNAYGSYDFLLSHDNSRLFYNGNVYDANLTNLAWLNAEVFACSSNGTVVFTSTQVFDGTSWLPMHNLPVTSTVMAVDGADQNLWYYNSISNTIESLPLSLVQQPMIVQQPTNQSIMSGNTAVIGVGAAGRSPLFYSWYFNGTNFTFTTSNQVLIPNFQSANVGNYSVIITNAFGTITSSNAAITVSYVPPNFINQPSNLTAQVGSDATFGASATGSLPIAYQWRFNGLNINGATNPVLNLANLQLTNGGNYDVVATNDFGSTNSLSASLNVVDLAAALNTTNLNWITGGDAPWSVDFTTSHDGYSSLQSGAITNGQQSLLQTTVAGPGTLTYWWNVSSEGANDYLNFSVNGVEQARIFGVVIYGFYGWVMETNYLGAGPNLLQWDYVKTDSGVSISGRDSGWVDQVTFTPGGTPPFVTINPANQVVLEGSNATLNATALGTPPLNYQWQLNGTNVDGATNATLVLTNAQFTNEGNYSLVISNAFGVTNTTAAFVNVVDFTESLNDTNLVWNTSGDKAWFPETSTTHDGVAALQSGAISGSQKSTVSTTVSGPGTLSLWWRVSSETNNDYVNVTVDGIEQARISGLLSQWQQRTFYLTNGSHSLAWNYTKNATINIGSDAAWLDQVSYVPGGTGAFIATNPVSQIISFGGSALFSVTAQGTPPFSYQWLFNHDAIPGATNSTFAVTNAQIPNAGGYTVTVANDFGNATSTNATLSLQNVYAWGAGLTNAQISPNYGQSIVPTNAVGVVAVAAGGYHSLELSANGRVTAWGYNGSGQTNVPATLTNAAAIAAGLNHSVALKSNGTVSAWGSTTYGQTSVPAAGTNLSAVAAGWYHTLALRSNGTVVAWGAGTSVSSSPYFGQSMVPTNLTGVAAIAAGGYHSVALLSNGTVVAWGLNASGQTNVPPGLTNVIAIAAGSSNTIALKTDGSLVAWGDNSRGQTNIPATLTNVVAVSAGIGHNMALASDGTLTVWGWNGNGQTNVPSAVSNVMAIAAGGFHSMALVNTGPPASLCPLQSLTVFKGSNAVLTGAVLGAAPLNYQWLKEGGAVSDATNASLAIAPAQITDSGNYQLVASNGYGAVTSSVVVLTVNDTAPFFILQPGNQNVLQYTNATMTATVGGIPPFTYQWQFNGINIGGATNVALTISNAQPVNRGNYSLIASNSLGVAISSNAFLNVIDLPEALGPTNSTWVTGSQLGWRPESTNTLDGFAAGIVLSTGKADTVGLQTSLTGPATITFWCQVPSGFTSLYFSVDNSVVATFPGQFSTWKQVAYYLPAGTHLLGWDLGNATVQSTPAQAFLDEVVFAPGSTAPTITSQPLSQTNSAGNSVTFAAGTGGTPPMNYQWYFNGEIIPNATGTSLTLANIQASDMGLYSFSASNAMGIATSSNATLTVIPSAPAIATQPTGMSLLLGGQATFTATAKGSMPLIYQWLANGSPIGGATNSFLTINNVQSSDGANYSLFVSNSIGTTVSSNAFLFVYSVNDLASSLDNPGITWSTTNVPWFPETNITHDGVSAAQSGVISGSQQSTLQGIATGPATIVYWWKVNCDSFWDSLAFSLNGTIQNSIAGNVDWQMATNYIGDGPQVIQWNLYPVHGSFAGGTGWVDQVQLIPGGTAAAIATNPANLTNTAGNSVTFSASAFGTPPFQYQWQFDGIAIPNATNSSLTLTNIQATNAGTYVMIVTNEFGSATSSNAALVVNSSPPVITSQPASQTAVVNSSVTLSVTAKGSSPFSYQWFFNSVAIPNATNSSQTIQSVQLTNSGIYNVVISNAYGSATSTNALLDVSKTRVLDYWPEFYPAPYSTPLGLGNVIAVAAGTLHGMGLRSDGSVVVWGGNTYGQTNVPPGLTNVVAIASGNTHCLALRSDGTVAAWGDDRLGQADIPVGLSNVMAISTGPAYSLALQSNGCVVAWGDDSSGQIDIPSGLTNATAVFAGYYNAFALLADGSVRQWGNGPVWQHNGTNTQLNFAPAMSNVVATVASGFTAWTLQSDGNVLAWGWYDGISPYTNSYVSSLGSYTSYASGTGQQLWYPGAVGIVSSGGGTPISDYALILTLDGRISEVGGPVYAGSSSTIPYIPSNFAHIVDMAGAYQHAVVLVNDGTPWVVSPLGNRVATSGAKVTLSAGVAGDWPMTYQWQYNGTNIDAATNAQLVLTNIPLTSGGVYQSIVSNGFGATTNSARLTISRSLPRLSVVSFGRGTGFQLNVSQLSGHGPAIIYSSTNLFDWQPIFTNEPTTDPVQLLDPCATNTPRQFYRVIEQ